MLTLVTAPRWSELVPHVSGWLRERVTDPFQTARIVVSGTGAGRLLGQDLATHDGISAGVDMVSPGRWVHELSRLAGVEDEWRAWQGQALVMAALQTLDEAAASHPLLASYLAQDRPARNYTLASRAAGLFRRYAEYAPSLVQAWLDGEQHDLNGDELPPHLDWQPELLRLATQHLQIDPLELQEEVAAAATSDSTATGIFAVDEIPPLALHALCQERESAEIPIWQISGSVGEQWAQAMPGVSHTSPKASPLAPKVEVHSSHGTLRQAEVLRDRLTALFENDITLEPRDVVIVCAQPEDYSVALDMVFGASTEEDAHPGRGLRMQPQGYRMLANPALQLLESLIALPLSRASAPELTRLLLSPAIAHRWRLADHGDDVVALISGSGIRWGLDSSHRAHFGLAGLSQGTWLSGLDSLLTGLALARGSAPVLAAPAMEGVSSSDLELVGSLCEVLSRLRKFVAGSRAPAPLREWVDRLRTALTELAGFPPSEEWMLAQAHAVLTDLAEAGQTSRQLNRAEFARVLSAALPRPRRRSPAGNGAIQVIRPGELLHAEFRVVVFLGMDDDATVPDGADAVDLEERAPDPRTRRRQRLLAHARAAETLLIVQRRWSERSNAPVATPVVLTRLLRELSPSDKEETNHPAKAFSVACRGNAAERAADEDGAASSPRTPQARRRREASSLPIGEPAPSGIAEQVTIAELASFLDNPAKAFLRSRVGLTYFPPPELRDDLPLTLAGLDAWQVQHQLLQAAQEGQDPETASMNARRQANVPPGPLGAVVVDDALTLVKDLWVQAAPDWRARSEVRPVELDLGGVVLADSVQVREGNVVAVTVSSGPKTLLGPWLSALALSACGQGADVVVHRVAKDWGRSFPDSRRLTVPPPQQALSLLRTAATAWRIGRQRLLAVPFEPAVACVQELSSRKGLQLADWQLPITDFRSRWRFRHESWGLFFGDRPDELFDDPATAIDPPSPAALLSAGVPSRVASSRFVAWAMALYRPLLTGELS
ncbi:MAG: exodeoxyribonuclease V subunit gamma [Tessaracoccus sp.]